METTISLPLIPSVDLATAQGDNAGLTRHQLGYLGLIYFTVTEDNIEKALGFLQRHVSMKAYADCTALNGADVLSILDAGARTVFVKDSQIAPLEQFGDRIALASSASERALRAPAGGATVLFDTDAEAKVKALLELKTSQIGRASCRERVF